MRIYAVVFLLQTAAACASQIDLALIQFPETKTVEALNEALLKVSLAEISNSNRTVTKERALQGGIVIFSQRTDSSNLNSSTRLGDNRADISGSYKNGQLDIQIAISEGVDSGLRSFTKRLFQGRADLPRGTSRVLSLRQIKRKVTVSERGRSEVRETETTTALMAFAH